MPLRELCPPEPASPIPVALLPASAAPETAPLAAPAAAPTITSFKVFFAFFKMPGEERLLPFFVPVFFFPDLLPDFLAPDFFLPDFLAGVLAAICTPLLIPHEATLPLPRKRYLLWTMLWR